MKDRLRFEPIGNVRNFAQNATGLHSRFGWVERDMYFHVSRRAWNIGDVIQPGMWGDRVKAVTTNRVAPNGGYQRGDLVNILWEGALEVARQVYAPNAPSRMNIVFLFTARADAEAFQGRIGEEARVYEVRPVNDDAPHHLADMDRLHDVPDHLIDHVHDRCRDYWTQPPVGTQELLWGGTVAVIR